MKQLILDGYNVINKVPELQATLERSLQAAREALIDYMAYRSAHWCSEFKVTVVFDARKVIADLMPLQVRKGITIIFSEPPHDADEVIIRKLGQAKHASSITVVSDDNKIANHVRAYKGKLLRVREFVDWINKGENFRRQLKPQALSKKHQLDSVTSDDITEELKKIWK